MDFGLLMLRLAQGVLPDSWAGCKPCLRFVVWMRATWERGRPAPHPYSCQQPPIHGHSLEMRTESAFTGFHSTVPGFVREGRSGLEWSGDAAAAGDCGVGRRFFWESGAVPNGCFLFAAFAAGLARTHTTPGCHPGLQEAAKRRHRVIVWRGEAFFWRSNAFPNGCFLFAAFAAGLARTHTTPGCHPGLHEAAASQLYKDGP